MDKLYHLREVVQNVYAGLVIDVTRAEIRFNFKSMLNRPLIRFDEAYSAFITGVAQKSDTYDLWLNIQMRVITALGEHQGAFQQLVKMVQEVIQTTEGGEAFDVAKASPDWQRYSFLVALAFRVYLDDFPIAMEDQPTLPAEKEGKV